MDKLRNKLYKEMESWVSDLVTNSDLPKRELLSAYAYEYCIKDEIISYFDGCNDEEWNDYYNDLLKKDNTLEYLYGEYMENDTANIQDVIADFMYFDKGYYEFVNE